jgi:hypothetical protein
MMPITGLSKRKEVVDGDDIPSRAEISADVSTELMKAMPVVVKPVPVRLTVSGCPIQHFLNRFFSGDASVMQKPICFDIKDTEYKLSDSELSRIPIEIPEPIKVIPVDALPRTGLNKAGLKRAREVVDALCPSLLSMMEAMRKSDKELSNARDVFNQDPTDKDAKAWLDQCQRENVRNVKLFDKVLEELNGALDFIKECKNLVIEDAKVKLMEVDYDSRWGLGAFHFLPDEFKKKLIEKNIQYYTADAELAWNAVLQCHVDSAIALPPYPEI